jgi:predicted RNA binding protein YcfA (HicA-like mRNA interferase family)
MSLDKRVQKLIKLLKEHGWVVSVNQSKHYKIAIEKNKFKKTIIVSASASDVNAIRSIIKDFRNAVRQAGYNILDSYNSYLITEVEFEDILSSVVERMNNIADNDGIYEETVGNTAILESLMNCAHDDYFTNDIEAINEWESFRKQLAK